MVDGWGNLLRRPRSFETGRASGRPGMVRYAAESGMATAAVRRSAGRATLTPGS